MNASITSSVILWSNPQTDGTINVREQHQDSLGKFYYFDYVGTAQTDQNAILATHAAEIAPQQARAELQDALNYMLSGNDPRSYIYNWNDPSIAYAQLIVMMVSIPSAQAIPFAPIASTYDADTLQADVPGLTAQQAGNIVAWATHLNSAYTAIQQSEDQRLALASALGD